MAPSGPIIINDTLFIESQDSNVYAVPLEEFTKELSGQNTDAVSESDSQNNTMLFIAGVLIIVVLMAVFFIYKRERA